MHVRIKYFWSIVLITVTMQITLINIFHFIEVVCEFTIHLAQ